MVHHKDFFLDFDSLIQKELSELAREYGLHNNVLRKVGTFYLYQPSSIGNARKVIEYLYSIFLDYGYNGEDFSKYIRCYSELVCCKPAELERKIVILNSQGLLETILFNKPYSLLDNQKLSSLDIYAISKSLKKEGLEVTYDSLYAKEYTSLQLEKLRELYPLKALKYKLFMGLFENKRKHLREQNNALLSFNKRDEANQASSWKVYE